MSFFMPLKFPAKNKSLGAPFKARRRAGSFVKAFLLFAAFAAPKILFSAPARLAEGQFWIKADQMPFDEFRAQVEALGPPHISYAESRLREARQRAKSFRLKDKLIKAQELYLSGEGLKADKAFRQIIQLALLADWDEEDRRIILYSFLRKAQGEKDPQKRKAILMSASAFALFPLNSSSYPDYKLFPPPLMRELEEIQDKSNELTTDWESLFPSHEIILINGELISKSAELKIPQAFYRISAFSSSHQPWSKNISLAELLSQKISPKSLTKGACGNLKKRSNVAGDRARLLPFASCPKPAILRLAKTESAGGQGLAKQPGFKSPVEALSGLEGFEPKPEKSWLSDIPPWALAGGGIVLLSIILSIESLSEKDKGPAGEFVY